MDGKTEVWRGTLALMALKTLEVLGPQHGYGIARRIEQTSERLLSINQGTLYPVLLKLEQEGSISAEWAVSDKNRRAKVFRLTKAGRKLLASETLRWYLANGIIGRFLALREKRHENPAPQLSGRRERELAAEMEVPCGTQTSDHLARGLRRKRAAKPC